MRVSSASVSANHCENTLNDANGEPVTNLEFGDRGSPDPNPERPDYWEGYLADVPALELPTDRLRLAALGPAMGLETCTFPEELSDDLRRLSRETGLDVALAGLAVFSVLLHRYTAQDKFVVATCRDTGRLLPVVADFSDRPSFLHLLHRLEAAACTGSKVGPVPSDLAVKLGIEADPSRHSIFQVAFCAAMGDTPSGSPSVFVVPPSTGLDLYLELTGSSQLSLRLHYNQDLFESGTAARMLSHIQMLLTGAIEDINRSSAELPMLTDRELQEQLVERNKTAREYPNSCLHELVEAMAAKTPHDIAVVYAQEQLSYAELNARANQMAHYLRKRGVGRNSRVGICLPRSLDFAVALLGVLKAGGACVPLDPTYPNERLTLMLGNVAAPSYLPNPACCRPPFPTELTCCIFHRSASSLRESRATIRAAARVPRTSRTLFTRRVQPEGRVASCCRTRGWLTTLSRRRICMSFTLATACCSFARSVSMRQWRRSSQRGRLERHWFFVRRMYPWSRASSWVGWTSNISL